MEISFNLDVPEGYIFIGYRQAECGDYYMEDGIGNNSLNQWKCEEKTISSYLIFKKVETYEFVETGEYREMNKGEFGYYSNDHDLTIFNWTSDKPSEFRYKILKRVKD